MLAQFKNVLIPQVLLPFHDQKPPLTTLMALYIHLEQEYVNSCKGQPSAQASRVYAGSGEGPHPKG